jgi:hypothetical protein
LATVTPHWMFFPYVILGLVAIAAGTWGLAVGDDSFATWIQFAVAVVFLANASQAHQNARSSSSGDT